MFRIHAGGFNNRGGGGVYGLGFGWGGGGGVAI